MSFQFGIKKNRKFTLVKYKTYEYLQVFLVFLLLLFYLYCPCTGWWFSHSGPTTKNIDNIPKHSANQFQCWSPSCPRHNLKAKRHSPCCEWDFGVLSSGHQMLCHNETLWWLLSDRALFLGKSPAVWERGLACRCSILSFNFHSSKIYNASCNIDLHGTSSVHVSISISTMFISVPVVKPLISVIQLVELSNFFPNDASEHLVGQSIFLSQHATTHLTEHFV